MADDQALTLEQARQHRERAEAEILATLQRFTDATALAVEAVELLKVTYQHLEAARAAERVTGVRLNVRL